MIRVVPGPANDSGLNLCNGTKVFVGDTNINGVYSVTLRADVNSVWRAVIECYIDPPVVDAKGEIIVKKESRIARFFRRIFKVQREVTSFDSDAREYD